MLPTYSCGVTSAVAPGDIIGRTRNHARSIRSKEDDHRCDISGLDPRHAKRCLSGENLSGLFLVFGGSHRRLADVFEHLRVALFVTGQWRVDQAGNDGIYRYVIGSELQ